MTPNNTDEKLTPHFSRGEFACRCGCGFANAAPALLFALEAVREHFDSPVQITCGCRCAKHNAETPGAAPDSRHTHGDAADIKVKNVPPAEVADYCETLIGARGGVGRYRTFTHIDTRGAAARWNG